MGTRRHLSRAAGFAAALLLAGNGAAQETLRVSGTGSALGTMRRLAGRFEATNPGLRVHLLPSVGSSGAFRAVADGALDIGISGRRPGPGERALRLATVPYARTPFVFAVGPGSEVTGITSDEAVRMYRGELRHWANGERIRVVLRPKGDVDTSILRSISREMAAAVDAAHAREGMLVAATNQQCDELLLTTPGAIGPSTLTQLVAEASPLRALSWNGVAPTVQNLASGAYPIEKTFLLVVRPSPAPAVRRFLAFLGSPEARTTIEQTGNLAVPLAAVE